MDSRSSARPRFKERANTVCSFNWRYEKAARFNGNGQNGNWVIMHSRLRWILVQWASLFADFRVFPHCVGPRVYTAWLISTWILWSNVRWLETYELMIKDLIIFLHVHIPTYVKYETVSVVRRYTIIEATISFETLCPLFWTDLYRDPGLKIVFQRILLKYRL